MWDRCGRGRVRIGEGGAVTTGVDAVLLVCHTHRLPGCGGGMWHWHWDRDRQGGRECRVTVA